VTENPPLFYVTEPRFGCSQPVRVGDLLRVKDLGSGWRLEGKLFLVTGAPRVAAHEAAIGIVDGNLEDVWIAHLEVIGEF